MRICNCLVHCAWPFPGGLGVCRWLVQVPTYMTCQKDIYNVRSWFQKHRICHQQAISSRKPLQIENSWMKQYNLFNNSYECIFALTLSHVKQIEGIRHRKYLFKTINSFKDEAIGKVWKHFKQFLILPQRFQIYAAANASISVCIHERLNMRWHSMFFCLGLLNLAEIIITFDKEYNKLSDVKVLFVMAAYRFREIDGFRQNKKSVIKHVSRSTRKINSLANPGRHIPSHGDREIE